LNLQFIVNPSAGHGQYRQIIHDIEKVLSGSQVCYDIAIPTFKGEAVLMAKEASINHDVVVAVGGDGTVNEVINGLVDTDATLGIIPAGTGNGFAREFGIPLHPKEACKVLLEGHTRQIDIGQADGRYFSGFAGMGFDALIAKFTGEMFGPLRGMWIYFFGGMLVFNRYKPQTISIEIDSETMEIRPLIVAVANTKRYGGRAFIAPNAVPDDGMFDVCVIRYMGPWKLFWNLSKLFSGDHIKLPYVTIYRSEKVLIYSSEPFPVHLDGEAIDSCCKIQFDIIPNAIKLIVPQEGGKELKS
jgi:diacylglycerol kinase (ATP)